MRGLRLWTQPCPKPLCSISKLAATCVVAETQTNSSRTTQNAVQSPLLSLPAELRNMGLEWAYGECQVVVSAACKIDLTPTMSLANNQKAPRPICQQFWREASDFFWRHRLWAGRRSRLLATWWVPPQRSEDRVMLLVGKVFLTLAARNGSCCREDTVVGPLSNCWYWVDF